MGQKGIIKVEGRGRGTKYVIKWLRIREEYVFRYEGELELW